MTGASRSSATATPSTCWSATVARHRAGAAVGVYDLRVDLDDLDGPPAGQPRAADDAGHRLRRHRRRRHPHDDDRVRVDVWVARRAGLEHRYRRQDLDGEADAARRRRQLPAAATRSPTRAAWCYSRVDPQRRAPDQLGQAPDRPGLANRFPGRSSWSRTTGRICHAVAESTRPASRSSSSASCPEPAEAEGSVVRSVGRRPTLVEQLVGERAGTGLDRGRCRPGAAACAARRRGRRRCPRLAVALASPSG